MVKPKRLEDIIKLNGLIEMKSKGSKTKLRQNGTTITIPYKGTIETPNLKEVLSNYKGEVAYTINSDVLDIENMELPLIKFYKHNVYNLIRTIITNYLPYHEYISKVENATILIYTYVSEDYEYISIQSGVIDDIFIKLVEIQKNDEKEEGENYKDQVFIQ